MAASISPSPRATRTFRLTEAQQKGNRLLGGRERHLALVGGARSGKTFLAVRAIFLRALKAPGSRHAIIRYRENAVWRSIGLDTLPAVMRLCFPGIALMKRPEGYFLLPNKSEIWLAGLDEKERTERILGQEFCTLYFNECSQIKYAAVVIALTRLAQVVEQEVNGVRSILPQKAYYDLNPLGRGHWTNRLFGDGRDPVSMQPLKNPGNYARLFMNPYDNKENLTSDYIESLEALPERQRKRFLEGKYVDEWDNALWTYEQIERCRAEYPGDDAIKRVVVAVDPSGAASEDDTAAAQIGIVVAALGHDGHAYVLADWTCLDGPAGWGKRVAAAAEKFGADCVVAEKNFGGDMVRFVLKTANSKLNVKVVTASRGKAVRAEPVSALYGDEHSPVLVHHCERFTALEEEMSAFTTVGYMGETSPNRADALVWALTELMLVGINPAIVSPIIMPIQVVPHGTIDVSF